MKQTPMGEYDRHITLLTKERGKITAFARGARRPGSRLAAATNPFSFGTFKLYAGRDSYTVSEAEISNYFPELMSDFGGAYYGMYFCELADYYTRENNDEVDMLKLIYQSLRALTSQAFSHKLVRSIFELKAIMINGEFPGVLQEVGLQESTVYTVDYIMRTPVEKLYSFTVSEEVLHELRIFNRKLCAKTLDRNFKSLEILENLE